MRHSAALLCARRAASHRHTRGAVSPYMFSYAGVSARATAPPRRLLSSEPAPSVPIIDISELTACKGGLPTAELACVPLIREACSTWGFFQVVNHGIPDELVSRFYTQSDNFFKLPTEVKDKVRRTETNSKGWYDDELTKQRVDWKQGFDVGAQDGDLDGEGMDGVNQWPDDASVPGFEGTVREYYAACEEVARQLTCCMALGLDKKASYFAHEFDNVHSSYLRLNYYPKCPNPDDHMAISHHTDAGAVTVLSQTEVESLEVWQCDDSTNSTNTTPDPLVDSGSWFSVAPVPGALVINTGDIMQVWSNDVYKAPLHRVKAQEHLERFSAPFFYNPSYETNYAPEDDVAGSGPARYRAINWGTFRMARFGGDYADVGAETQISDYRIR